MPLVDMLAFLARRHSTGRLSVILFPDLKRYEIHLDCGKISHVASPQGAAPDETFATMTLVEILTVENGTFYWERNATQPEGPKLEMPVESTLMHALSIGDEINHGPRR